MFKETFKFFFLGNEALNERILFYIYFIFCELFFSVI